MYIFTGKTTIKAMFRKQKQAMSKDQRRNQALQVIGIFFFCFSYCIRITGLITNIYLWQIRKNKRDDVMDKKRLLGRTAPFLVGIIPLHEQIDPQSALAILKSCDPNSVVSVNATGATHIT